MIKYVTLLVIQILISTKSFSQSWIQTSGPSNGVVMALFDNSTDIFAGTYNGPFITTNNGNNWTLLSSSISDVRSFCYDGVNLFCGSFTSNKIYLSNNYGNTWVLANTGLPTLVSIRALLMKGTDIFAGTSSGVYYSNNNGSSWTQVNNGLTNQDVLSLAHIGNDIFVGTYGGVFRSSNNGSNWVLANTGINGFASARQLVANGLDLFAVCLGYGIFKSSNNGANWTPINNGLTSVFTTSISVLGSTILVGTYGDGAFISSNYGASWTQINNGLTNLGVYSVLLNGTNGFAGTNQAGVFRIDLSNILQVNDPNAIFKTLISPNPTTQKLTVDISNLSKAKAHLVIRNSFGETVMENKLFKDKTEINLDEPNGIYFATITTEKESYTGKIVLQR